MSTTAESTNKRALVVASCNVATTSKLQGHSTHRLTFSIENNQGGWRDFGNELGNYFGDLARKHGQGSVYNVKIEIQEY